MKKYFYILVAFCFLSFSNSFSQEKSAKNLKQENSLQKSGRVEKLINSKNFEFVGITAFPSSLSPVDLAANPNSVIFTPDLIMGDMPFYGTGYSGMTLSHDTGLRFQGKPENYTLVKKGTNYEISTIVNGKQDTFSISLSVSGSGSAMLTISSNDRSTISYQGEIKATEQKKK